MTHKLQEVEDAHVIAELRQRVASLEVQIQEFVTTGQLNDNEKNMYMYQQMSGSSISLADFSYDDVCIKINFLFFRIIKLLNRFINSYFNTSFKFSAFLFV